MINSMSVSACLLAAWIAAPAAANPGVEAVRDVSVSQPSVVPGLPSMNGAASDAEQPDLGVGGLPVSPAWTSPIAPALSIAPPSVGNRAWPTAARQGIPLLPPSAVPGASRDAAAARGLGPTRASGAVSRAAVVGPASIAPARLRGAAPGALPLGGAAGLEQTAEQSLDQAAGQAAGQASGQAASLAEEPTDKPKDGAIETASAFYRRAFDGAAQAARSALAAAAPLSLLRRSEAPGAAAEQPALAADAPAFADPGPLRDAPAGLSAPGASVRLDLAAAYPAAAATPWRAVPPGAAPRSFPGSVAARPGFGRRAAALPDAGRRAARAAAARLVAAIRVPVERVVLTLDGLAVRIVVEADGVVRSLRIQARSAPYARPAPPPELFFPLQAEEFSLRQTAGELVLAPVPVFAVASTRAPGSSGLMSAPGRSGGWQIVSPPAAVPAPARRVGVPAPGRPALRAASLFFSALPALLAALLLIP